MNQRSQHWQQHYRHFHSLASTEGVWRSMEYSNERCQIQLYAYLLEAVGPLAGKRVLDVGCGWGVPTRIFDACGATAMGIDLVSETISELQRRHPHLQWQVIDILDEDQMRQLGLFDVVVAMEVLQYVDFTTAMTNLWPHVAPGGRLIGFVPNSACPIVAKVRQRFDGMWLPLSQGEIRAVAATLPGAADLRIKGLRFRTDQSFLPYETTDWSDRVDGAPNRLVFVISRREC
jgi:2-polyprenyl-3-methyl-5-hydroxy-6-metoxy-1,4-benzoquinol methylase